MTLLVRIMIVVVQDALAAVVVVDVAVGTLRSGQNIRPLRPRDVHPVSVLAGASVSVARALRVSTTLARPRQAVRQRALLLSEKLLLQRLLFQLLLQEHLRPVQT